MSPVDAATAGSAGGPAEALTIVESKANKSPVLNLASTGLSSVPEGVGPLKHVSSLNLSDNPIKELPEVSMRYPPQLSELNVAGCQLTTLPTCLSQLPELKNLHAGANSLLHAEAVFACPVLQHANLAFNRLSNLPNSLGSCPIISLDLSHNNLENLTTALANLQALPMLRILSLTGNPVALLPQYDSTVRQTLKNLRFFDGVKLEGMGAPGSRAGTAASQQQVTPQSFATGCAADTLLRLELTGLQPEEDPFKDVRAAIERPLTPQGADQAAAATASAKDAQPVAAKLPLQPYRYHVEVTDADGTSYSSIPLVIAVPTPPDTTKDTKQKGKPPGKSDKTEPVLVPELKRGRLCVTLGVNATTQWRDWLRKGFEIRFVSTQQTAVERPMTEAEAAEFQAAVAAAAAKAAKSKSKADPSDGPPLPPFDIVTKQEVAGVATVRCVSLVTGHSTAFEGLAEFIPVPALWDERGIRMGLEDERHPTKPAGRMQVKMQLHSQTLLPVM